MYVPQRQTALTALGFLTLVVLALFNGAVSEPLGCDSSQGNSNAVPCVSTLPPTNEGFDNPIDYSHADYVVVDAQRAAISDRDVSFFMSGATGSFAAAKATLLSVRRFHPLSTIFIWEHEQRLLEELANEIGATYRFTKNRKHSSPGTFAKWARVVGHLQEWRTVAQAMPEVRWIMKLDPNTLLRGRINSFPSKSDRSSYRLFTTMKNWKTERSSDLVQELFLGRGCHTDEHIRSLRIGGAGLLQPYCYLSHGMVSRVCNAGRDCQEHPIMTTAYSGTTSGGILLREAILEITATSAVQKYLFDRFCDAKTKDCTNEHLTASELYAEDALMTYMLLCADYDVVGWPDVIHTMSRYRGHKARFSLAPVVKGMEAKTGRFAALEYLISVVDMSKQCRLVWDQGNGDWAGFVDRSIE